MPEWIVALMIGCLTGGSLGILFGLILAFVHSLND